MIKFEIDVDTVSVEVLLDSDGVDEFVNYLHFIKEKKESIHLTIGNELNGEDSQNGNKIISHVKLIYVE